MLHSWIKNSTTFLL